MMGARARERAAGGLVGLFVSIGAIIVAFAIGALILAASGHHPLAAYQTLLDRVTRPAGLAEVIVRAIPLAIAGGAVLIGVRAGIWNIGVDGQVLVGALACGVMGGQVAGHVPAPVLWLLAAAVAVAAGAIWAGIAGVLRARFGMNEIITTIMLNYVALSLTSWLVKGPLRDPTLVSPQTPLIPIGDRLPHWGTTRVHLGLGVAIAVVLGLALLFRRSRVGLELRVVGENPRAARHAMLPVDRLIVLVMLISGGLAGLAGANDILSTKGTFQSEWNPQYGLAAFALVFLAQRKPLGLAPAALVLGFLAYGADILPRAANVAPDFFSLLEGLILIALAVVGVAQGRWSSRQPVTASPAARPATPPVQETVS